jgi:dTDP-glucose pyrophosphorylase
MNSSNDGIILTFDSTHPKWSYAKVEDNVVVEVAEKKPISNHATVGFYGYKKGSSFVRSAYSMIKKDIRVNNEFYVAPTINELIQEGQKFIIQDVEEMYGVGTPEDLQYYLTKI